MKAKCKVIEFRFNSDRQFKTKVIKDNLSPERAKALADKLNAKQDKSEDFSNIVSFKVA